MLTATSTEMVDSSSIARSPQTERELDELRQMGFPEI
jgi:hypothetical protein